MVRFSTVLLLVLSISTANAQTPQDAAVPIQITIGINPPAVLINWPNPVASDVTLRRRVKGQPGNAWTTVVTAPFTYLNGYFDVDVSGNTTYEYALERKTGSISAYGYAYAAISAPMEDDRGKVIVVVDSIQADQLGPDLVAFENDLRGEGWQVLQYKSNSNSTVQSVKNQITNAYNADPAAIKTVLLLGSVPVPYSGSKAWDNQSDHVGAWPCDAYYGDVNGAWTDNSVNIPATTRPANRNIPGDGKFDQNTIPSVVELAVGRIDFRHLSANTFGASPVELLRKYLQKNHRWRTGQYKALNRAVVDDNLGWSAGAAYAADGFRNAYPLTGGNQVFAGSILQSGNAGHYLMGYGSGINGSYSNAPGVASATDFAQDSVNFVFAGLFGDYIGDWDYETNPLLPAALASKGGLLACGWAGLPHWFLQGLACGETIGFCLKETQNAQYNAAYDWTDGKSGAHVALMGDPTLRARIVTPVTNLAALSNCTKVNLHWTASPDSGVLGYVVYRSFDLNGPYQRMTVNPLYETSWIDISPVPGPIYYTVRAVKIESVPGGGIFYNSSTGPIAPVYFTPGQGPTVIGLGGDLTCTKTQILLGANFQPPTCTVQWTAPDGSLVSGYYASTPGVYSVVATAPNGCTAMAFATVNLDTTLAPLDLPRIVTLTCVHPTSEYVFPPVAAGVVYTVNAVPVQPGETVSWTTSSVVTVSSTINGCSKTYLVSVIHDTLTPGATITGDGNNLDCTHSFVQLSGSATTSDVFYSWWNPGLGGDPYLFTQNVTVTEPGTYCLQTTAPNGCTSTACIDVTATGQSMHCQITPDGTDCNNGTGVILEASATGGVLPFHYLWSTGETTQQITRPPGFTGTVSVTITDSLQCTGSAVYQVAAPMTVLALKTKESILGAHDGRIDLLVNGGIAPFSFLWNTGATSQDIEMLGSGIYMVTVTDVNGCTASLTIPLITTSGTETAEADHWIQLMPNPADRYLMLQVPGNSGGSWVVWSAAGAVCAQGEVPLGQDAFELDVSGLAEGVYVVQLRLNGDRRYWGRFAVVR
jgi:hypothetical protein